MVMGVSGKKCCLIVIDGWGVSREEKQGNAIETANTPTMKKLSKEYPYMELTAHGRAVGLPTGLMGNSEVGHLNIGAGRVVFQDIVRIEMAIEEGEMERNAKVVQAFNKTKEKGSRLHLIGLVSDGGVHSHINHLKALLRYTKNAKVEHVYVHAITDGRDTAPTSAIAYLNDLKEYMDSLGGCQLATIVGRYYGMDRDKRWERTKIAFDAFCYGQGKVVDVANLTAIINERYEKDERDEFLKPMILAQDGNVRDDDTVIFFNYRSDRMRQLVSSLGQVAELQFKPFGSPPKDLHLLCMTLYNSEFPFPVISPPQQLDNVLAEWLSKMGQKQFHTAETEKYAHVTFFFNGGRESPFPGEERRLIPSPKVATYDLEPTMSVAEVAESVADALATGHHQFIMCNFAPPDMVGHTGKFEPTVRAVEATDEAIGRVFEACERHDYVLLITADHGNAEKMVGEEGGEHTAHTCAPVPFIITNKEVSWRNSNDRPPALCDVAPTILDLMSIPKPAEMTGQSLIERRNG